jgi:hypothetical protein
MVPAPPVLPRVPRKPPGMGTRHPGDQDLYEQTPEIAPPSGRGSSTRSSPPATHCGATFLTPQPVTAFLLHRPP